MAKASQRLVSGHQNLPGTPALGDTGFDYLQCPRCGGLLIQTTSSRLECAQCHIPIAVHDGIVDFVAGASSTKLDDLDYDQFYSINEAASFNLFDIIRSSAGAFWPGSLGDAVEIGCGTGGFSSAVLRRQPADRVILTDVSVKMLDLCRKRLSRLTDLQTDTVTFSTYSGTEACFRPAVFDTCFGTSVVHHIIDVPHLLGQVHRLLKPGGRAFFMEPNARFHAALTATLAAILAEWSPRETVPEPQISLMMNWMAEVHCSIINSGDLEILAQREDKHYFLAETFEAMAEAAGFATATALPCGPDPAGTNAIKTYLAQSGVTEATLGLLRQAWPAADRGYFGALKPRDRSPSYLFWLEKTAKAPKRRSAAGRLSGIATTDGAAAGLPMVLWMTLAIQRRATGFDVVAEGWCLASSAVRAVRLTMCGISRRLPIYLPRRDVQAAMNPENAYPVLHALCSGINGTVRVLGVPIGVDPIQVDVEIVGMNGSVVPRGRYSVRPDGDSVLVG